jgi:branched-chain amino acid transport system permease protein
MKSALRDAGLSALIALGLFTPLIGLVTENGDHGLVLRARPIAVAAVVGLVFLGRLLIVSRRPRTAQATRSGPSPAVVRAGRAVAPVLLGVALLLPFGGSRYYVDLATLVLTYIMLGWGLNVVVSASGPACRSPALSRLSGAYCLAFPCCGCAAIISRSSHWRSVKSYVSF